MTGPEQAHDAGSERVDVLVAWWGGFVMGPVPALAVWWSATRGSRTRASARAAAVYWVTALCLWAAVIAMFIAGVIGDPGWLLLGAGVLVTVSAVTCALVTIRLRGGESSGKQR